jgi:hypothetical protein
MLELCSEAVDQLTIVLKPTQEAPTLSIIMGKGEHGANSKAPISQFVAPRVTFTQSSVKETTIFPLLLAELQIAALGFK